MRISGKNGLIQLQRTTDTPFDLSGVGVSGGRANDFSIEIATSVEDTEAYNENWTIPVAGKTLTCSFSATVYWDSVTSEQNDYLWTMLTEQHEVAGCTVPISYSAYWYPEGKCVGKEEFVITGVVIESWSPNTPANGVMTLQADFKGAKVTRGRYTE